MVNCGYGYNFFHIIFPKICHRAHITPFPHCDSVFRYVSSNQAQSTSDLISYINARLFNPGLEPNLNPIACYLVCSDLRNEGQDLVGLARRRLRRGERRRRHRLRQIGLRRRGGVQVFSRFGFGLRNVFDVNGWHFAR